MDLYVTTILVLLLKIHSVSAYSSANVSMCFGEYCFLTPGVNVTKTYDDANQWCIDNDSSNLMTDSNDSMHQIVTRFLDSSQLNSAVFIKLKLTPNDDNGAPLTWFLLNGSNYKGEVYNQEPRNIDYKYYIFLDSNYPQASNPNYKRNFICEYTETRCLNNGSDNYLTNGRCYIKYENETLTWFKARERCIRNGGDLVMLSNSENIQTNYHSSFGKKWLTSDSYWIGVRWNNRLWQSDDNGVEAIYTNWSNGEPNNYLYRCVCLSESGNPRWSWIDCDCNVPRPFVCLKFVPTTTPATTTTTTITTIMTTVPVSKSNSSSHQDDNDFRKNLGIGLGVGIGGAVVIAAVVLVIIFFIRKSRKSKHIPNRGTGDNYVSADRAVVRDNEHYAEVVSGVNGSQEVQENSNKDNVIYVTPDFSTHNAADD